MNDGQVKQLGTEQTTAKVKRVPYYEYKTVDSCGPTGSLHDNQDSCMTNQVTRLCPRDEGPRVDVWRRLMNPDGTPAPPPDGTWKMIGTTCRGNDVPGAEQRPTMAMIINAFHHTPWAKAELGFQPKGNRTLVNFPSYYQAKWTTAGFQPGEVDVVDPATMFGHRVEIRPKAVSYTYVYGDGETEGPTRSTGGTYPEGDVIHVYRQKGIYDARVSVRWGADFRIDGGAWAEIPDTVVVDQPVASITVLESRARLLPTK